MFDSAPWTNVRLISSRRVELLRAGITIHYHAIVQFPIGGRLVHEVELVSFHGSNSTPTLRICKTKTHRVDTMCFQRVLRHITCRHSANHFGCLDTQRLKVVRCSPADCNDFL